MAVTLRLATSADIPTLRRWDEKPHIIESGGEDGGWDWVTEIADLVDWREMLIAENEGLAIGFIQIIDPAREETQYWGDVPAGLRAIDIWIGEEAYIGKGYGREMMRQAIARCFAPRDVTAILIDPLASNTRAHRFYEAMGFRPVGPRRFGPDDCIVYRLERAQWRD